MNNKEETHLSGAYDRGELKLETPSSELLDMLASAGENTFKKNTRINVRLSSHDFKIP